MKKILVITTIIMLILSSCTYKNSEMYNKLTKQYPDSEIIKSGGNFKVISNSPEIDQNIKKNINTSGCAMIYETVEELQDSMNLVTCLVFKGVKTTTSKQCITYWQENDWVKESFTESIVKVTEAYYGDIETGDEIIYLESYAVFRDENDEEYIYGSKTPTETGNEYLFILSGNGDSKLFDGEAYIDHTSALEPLQLSFSHVYNREDPLTIRDDLYRKYIVDKDIKLDAQKETQKALEWRIDYASREHDKIDSEMSKIITPYKTDSKTEITSLTDEDKVFIDKMIQKYGEKDSSLAVK